LKIVKHIPNAITCGNLVCGCLAIISIFEGDLPMAAYLVGMALVLDFFDGFAARLLKVSSPIGKDLDSLADMVTFGVVPGLMTYKLLAMSAADTPWLKYTALIIPVFSCIRLAKFNNDVRQSDSFIGLPTPANAMVICSIPLIVTGDSALSILYINWLEQPYFLITMFVVLSLLLVSEIPLLALKFKDFKLAGNGIRYLFLGVSLLLILTLKVMAIPLIIVFYILLSIVNNIFFKAKV